MVSKAIRGLQIYFALYSLGAALCKKGIRIAKLRKQAENEMAIFNHILKGINWRQMLLVNVE